LLKEKILACQILITLRITIPSLRRQSPVPELWNCPGQFCGGAAR
jgi:hypothetical protein